MAVSWDNLTPIDEENKNKNKSASWDNLQPEGSNQNESGQPYYGSVDKSAYISKNGEIYNTPHESLFDKIGKVLNWVAITPFKAYSQGVRNDEAAVLEAKEIFHPLTAEEKAKMNSLENAQAPNFGIRQNDYVDENPSNALNRAVTSSKNFYAQTFENLPSSVEALKAGGIGSVVGGALLGVGGLAKGIFTGNPVGGTLEGINAGIRLGGGLGAAQKTFELEAGSARQELKQFRDKDGNPLPEDLINKCSIGVGIANSALETIGLAAELKTFPGMDKVFKQSKKDFLKKVVEDETLRGQLLNTAKQLGLSTATEVGTESLQQVSNIVADEYSKSVAGNYDDKLFEDGKINQGALRKHVGEVIQAGVGAIGPSLLIGGLGTATTASKILIQNGMESARAKKLADEMSVDERVDFINNNLDTVDKVAENQLSELEKQNYEKRFFDKAADVHKDENGNISAEKESQIFSAAKMVGQFLNKFGTKEEKENWFNKLEFTNKPVDALEGGVSMNVDAKDLPTENVAKPLMQKNAAYAGATENETADAVKQWKEKGTDSPYFQKWFSDSKVVNDEGKPLVVYHGTEQGGFETFEGDKRTNYGGISKDFNFFTNKKSAYPNSANDYAGKNGQVYETYLSMKKPMVISYANTPKESYYTPVQFWDANQSYIRRDYRKGDYDGIVIKNEDSNNDDSVIYLVPNSEQIKSTENQGTFSSDTGNIYYQKNNKDISKNIEKEFGDTVENIESMITDDVKNILNDNVVDDAEFNLEGVKLYGSYSNGTNKKMSDLDVLVQYSGSMREDAAFNMFANAKLKIQNVLGKNIKVDINPINTEKSGTIDEHLKFLDQLENKEKNSETYYQDKKSLTDLHKDYAEKKANKYLDYLGYFQKNQDKNIIGIMEDSNPSTLVHEMGHLFLQGLNEFSTSDKNARETLNQVNEWLGYTDGGYTDDQQEKFAEGFTAYLYNGKAPSNTLREVFENFKEWLRSVYNSLPDLGVKIDPEVQNIFDNIFSDKSEKEKEIDALVEKTKFVGLDKLSDTETRHKDVAYHILSVALGKSPKWLKTILESQSENPKILKQKEKIELSLEHVDDKISGADGFLPEWGEFFRNPLQWGEENDYQLALEAYNTIVDKTYKQNIDQLGFLDRTEQQYQYLLNQYEHAKDRDIPLAAYWTWIDDVESDFQQTYIDKFNQDTAYIERFEKMDKFEQAKEKILKAYRDINSHNSVENYRETVKAIMDGLKFLNPVDKAKLTANILDFSELGDLQYSLDNILDVAKTMQDVAYKKRLMDRIHQQLQFTKNIRQNNKTVGKYDYSTNKIFERLRELDGMSAEQANELRLELTDIQEENGLSFGDKIINAFTNYKANGVTYSSTEAVKGLYDDLVKMKIAGKDAKSELDFENKLNLANETIELVKVLDEKSDAKKITKWYLQGVANWESMLNGIFDKKIRDKYSLLEPERNAEIWAWQKKKKFEKGVAEIYGKNIKDFDDAIVKNVNTEYTFLENVPDVEDPDTFRQIPRKMNKMELILAYMWDKNEVLHERLLNQFGDIELERMFNELSPEDERLGDLMMETVNGFYPLVNEIFIKKYGIDLPRVEHYFPSQIERISDVDLMTDFAMKSTNPSAIKNRSSSAALTQKFDNPVKMLYKHIDSMSRFIYMSDILDKQNRILKNKTLQKIVEEKYGKDVYTEMLKMFMNNAFKQQMQNYSWFENKLDGLVSNWLIGNVAVKPSIAIKQLLSASNYASEMPYVKWQQGFLKACADPVGTYKLMSKIPYLDARFESGGQNEFLKNEISNSKLAKSAKFKEWASANIRLGDVGAIAFGGRPYLEYLMNEKGMSEDEAIKEFLNHTQRTMQASETSTLNNFQISMAKNKYGGKLLTAYENAQWQYFRMAGDAIVSYVNGDITGGQMAKTIYMYMFLNPFLYRSATSLSLVTLLATGNGDDLRDDAIGSLFDLNADCIPLLGGIYQYAINIIIAKAEENITGEKVDYFKTPEKTPLIGDIMERISKVAKDDVSLEDVLDFGSYGVQTFFGIPLNAFGCSLAGAGDIAQGNFAKGSLEVLGWSKKRAARAVGDDDE